MMSIIINDKSNFFDDNLSESPIEQIFLREIIKYLEVGTIVDQQIEYETKIGKFRVDFLIKKDNLDFIVELDGEKFHQENIDIWRDSFLLGEQKVKSIIRIKGKDITYNLIECLYILSELYPEIFSERGKINLSNLLEFENKEMIEDCIKNKDFKFFDKLYFSKIEYEYDLKKNLPSIEIIYRSQYEFICWKEYYEFAIKENIYDLAKLKEKFLLD